jgi:hypothetical protein
LVHPLESTKAIIAERIDSGSLSQAETILAKSAEIAALSSQSRFFFEEFAPCSSLVPPIFFLANYL